MLIGKQAGYMAVYQSAAMTVVGCSSTRPKNACATMAREWIIVSMAGCTRRRPAPMRIQNSS